ncbi:YtxH domain-containing protein [Sphaerisporangium sp. TRM90804]|uniref:YtxH domain-containing protein n=1 Tax=Sphaerisporangium sp. TRM90804 TaxID=3031113 RepID=UPI002448AD9D|nr:YtxH domain-containing protein [Sphaerisporangium sp. TRM90804]MDH2424950.1 YtxH domain-containing protein [Sphaerisporangium sp. TRM90804]
MRYRLTFAVGMAVGYVLGSRAGRERYEQIKRLSQRVTDNPMVQQAAGLAGAQASKAAEVTRHKLGDVLGDRVPFLQRNGWHVSPDDTGTGWPETQTNRVT